MPASDEFKNALRSGDLPEAFMMAMGKATELNITTRVIRSDGSIMGDSDPGKTLHTRLDLLNGTVENEIGEDFLNSAEYRELQHFHQQQVALGNRKIQENFQSLQQLFRLLVTLQQYNRLNNAETPLDLAFLEVPSHILPAEKVVTSFKEQQAILDSLPTPPPPVPTRATKIPEPTPEPPVTPPEAVSPPPEVIERPKPIPPKPMAMPPKAAAKPAPERPKPIPPKPMVAAAAVVATGAIANAVSQSAQQAKEEDEESLSFLDSFAALDLDEEREPLMPLSELEIDDWEAPPAMSPAQRLAQSSPEAYVPSLQDFDHDHEPSAPDHGEEALMDLDALLAEDEEPLEDLLEDDTADAEADLFPGAEAFDVEDMEEEPLTAAVVDQDDLAALDQINELLEEPEAFDDVDLFAEEETATAPIEIEDASLGETSDFDEFAAIATEELPEELLGDLLEETAADDDEMTAIALGQELPEAQQAIDADLEALLEEADSAHADFADLELSLEPEMTPDTTAAIATPETSEAELAMDTVMADTPLNELLAEADAVTPEMTADLLADTLSATESDESELDIEPAIATEPTDIDDIETSIEDPMMAMDDASLFDFLNQDWQSNPDVIEVTSLDDSSDPNAANLAPLSDSELAELEDLDDADDWQPLTFTDSTTTTGGLSTLDLDDLDSVPPPRQVAAPTQPVSQLDVEESWQPLGFASGQSINLDSLLPLELDQDDLALGDDELASLDLDAEDDLSMPLSQGDGDLGMLDSVDPRTANLIGEDLELKGLTNLENLAEEDLGAVDEDFADLVEDDLDTETEDFADLGDDLAPDLDENPFAPMDEDLLADETGVIADFDSGTLADTDLEEDLLAEMPDPFLTDVDLDDAAAFATDPLADLDIEGLDEIDNLDAPAIAPKTSYEFEIDADSLSDEVLSSIEELDQATADLMAPSDIEDSSLLGVLNDVKQEEDQPFAESTALADFEDANLEDFAAEDDFADSSTAMDLDDFGESELDDFSTDLDDDFGMSSAALADTADFGDEDFSSEDFDDVSLDTDAGFRTEDFEEDALSADDEFSDVNLDDVALDTDAGFRTEDFEEDALSADDELSDVNLDDVSLDTDAGFRTEDFEDEALSTDDDFSLDDVSLEADDSFAALEMPDDVDLDFNQEDIDHFGDGLDALDDQSFSASETMYDMGLEDDLSSTSSLSTPAPPEAAIALDLDAEFDLLEHEQEELGANIVVEPDPIALDLDAEFDLLDHEQEELSHHLVPEPDPIALDLDAEFDLLDSENGNGNSNFLQDDDPIDLDLDAAFDLLDNETVEAAIAPPPAEAQAWDNLKDLAQTDAADWDALQTPTNGHSPSEDWDLSNLEDLDDLNSGDLSGLTDFDIEALESDDNDEDFDLFGNEDSDPFNPFLESKS